MVENFKCSNRPVDTDSRNDKDAIIDALKKENQQLRASLEDCGSSDSGHAPCNLETTLNTIPVGVIIAEAGTEKILYYNNAAQAIIGVPVLGSATGPVPGRSRSVWMHRPDRSVILPDEWPLVRALRSGEVTKDLEVILKRIDGIEVTTLINCKPVRDSAGNIITAIASIVDITERKRTEEALEESKTRYHAILDSQTELISRFTPDYLMTFANETLLRYYGIKREDLIGHSVLEFLSQDQHDKYMASVASLGINNPRVTVENYIVSANGDVKWQQWVNTAILDGNGRLVEIQSVGRDITERKRAEESLKKSEEKYRGLFNSIDEGFCIIEKVDEPVNEPLDFRFVEANPAFKEQCGLNDVVGKTIRQVVQVESEEWLDIYETVLKTGRPIRFERNFHSQGRILELHASRMEDGTHRRVAVIFKDNTARKQIELLGQALNQINTTIISSLNFDTIMEKVAMEARLAIGFSNATVAIKDGSEWVLKYLYGEPQRPIGYRYSEKEVKSLKQLTSSRKPIILNNIQSNPDANRDKAQKFNISSSILIPLVMSDEVIGILSFSDSTRVHLTDAQVDFVTKLSTSLVLALSNAHLYEQVTLELGERKRAEEALREAKDYAENLIETANVLVIGLDIDGKVNVFNRTAEKIIGYSRAEIIGQSWELVVPRNQYGFVWEEFERIKQGGLPRNFENPVLTKTGDERHIVWQNNDVTQQGRIVGSISFGIDITERKQAEEALLSAKQQAELYLDLMGHDINNLHQIALGYLELARDTQPNGIQPGLLDKPIEVLNRCAQLIQNVRKLQKLNEGVLQTQKVNIYQVLQDVGGEFGEMSNKTIVLNPNGCEKCCVWANELLYDVFSNLVGNAIKHTGDHTDINLSIQIVTENKVIYCRVNIEDNGPGIPDDFKDKIFDRMLKGTSKAKGMGLGLYLVKYLVNSYNGRVWVEDRVPGDHMKGARFVVMLPTAE